MEKVLVLGAGFAGVCSALKLANREDYRVEVIDVDSYHEFTPGIIDIYRERLPETKLKRDLHDMFDGNKINFSREVVEDINPGKMTVETNAGTHEYSYLVLALGGQPRTFGMDLEEVYKPYDLEETKKVKEEIEEEDVDSVTVVGSGYVGIEIAGELSEKGLDVTIVEGGTRPMPNSNEKSSRKALNYLNRNDIRISLGNRAEEIEKDKVRLENGNEIESDLVLWAGGVKASDTVTEAFDADPEGIKVDEYLKSEKFENIYAAGDCAETGDLKTAHNAMKQGQYIGANLGKEEEEIKPYSGSEYPLMVSLGDTGMMVYGESAYKSRIFRHMKDLVRRKYWMDLKKTRILG